MNLISVNSGGINIAGAASPTTPGNNNNLKYVYQIRDQFYHIEIWLYNQLDGYKPCFIPFLSVEGLAIEESLVNWPTKGWIILKNDFELFERGSLAINLPEMGSVPKIPAPYVFRSDGRNRISVKIYPINNPSAIKGVSIKQDLPRDLWELNFDFVVYDIEDLPSNNVQNKSRKLYFHDERLQIMKERNIEWSTSLYGPNQGKIGSKDKDRAMPTNEALKSIIKTVSSKASNPLFPDLKVGYGDDGTIDNPSIPFDAIGDWDEGYAANGEPSNIIYTSPAHTNALKDLNYIYANCVSADNTPLILDFGRTSNDKKWHLRPLSYYFQNAEKNQIEKLILEDGMTEVGAPPYVARAPDMIGSSIQNFMSGIASRIKSYKFAPMVAEDDVTITNRPVHNFNFANSEFNIYSEQNSVTKVLQNMEEIAKQGLYAYNNNGQLLMNVNQTKQSGLMTSPYFEPQTFFPTNKPAIQMMKQILFLNQALYFRAPGLTFRTPGKFIFVDRITSSDHNPFDDRFLGQWMITKVMHLFTKDNYITDIVSTKVDAFKKMWSVLDTKY